MNLYPAMQFHMGSWRYYVVRMNMREIAESVQFAYDVHEDRTLDQAIQRVLNESRVKKDIVTYLQRQPDRFFSSIVIAAIDGKPQWFPVSIEDDPRFVLFGGNTNINNAFGILTFDGSQAYYALDGQHRLSAIKALVDKSSDTSVDAPDGFATEQVSVVVVVPSVDENDEEFLKKYRRLFGNLNRYAKPMDQVTNIIMDEDDVFAILTRRLITEHEFFRSSGSQRESTRIKTTKGKNLTKKDPYFTSLEALYEMNTSLLNSRDRRNRGWDDTSQKLDEFKRFRPTDEQIDELYEELKLCWDGILEALPVLRENPTENRNHDSDKDPDYRDNVLFWPIGQELLAEVAREALDRHGSSMSAGSVAAALKPMGDLSWDFHDAPWRHLLLIPDGKDSWRIRNEERKEAYNVARRIVQWQLGLDELDLDELSDLRRDWAKLLLPNFPEDSAEARELWAAVVEGRIED